MVEWWNGGEGGDDKTEKKEETDNRPLKEGDQRKVSGLEGLRQCELKRPRNEESSMNSRSWRLRLRWRFQSEFMRNGRQLRFVLWKG